MIVRICPILLPILLLAGCASADSAAPVDADNMWETPIDASLAGSDGGPALFADAGAGTDAAAGADGGPFTPSTEDFDPSGCFNGLDDDANELVDCADTACGASAYCCVGSATSACCSGAGVNIAADFTGCSGADPRFCSGAPLTWFGTPRPTIEGARFLPNGDNIDDSGLVLAEGLDPTRERVRLSATIAAPLTGCRDCLDVVALGLADRPSADDVRIVPDIAVMVRASRLDYALVIAGEVVWTHALEDGDPHDYQLEVSPDGAVALSVDATVVVRSNVALRSDSSALLYGRTHNRDGSTPSTRVSAVNLRSFGCDMPSAMSRADAAVIPFAGVPWGTRVSSDPSVVVEADGRFAAFVLDRDIHVARQSSDGTWNLGASAQVTAPVLVAETGEQLRDPELLRETDRYVLYLTQVQSSGVPRIVRADGEAGHREIFGALTPVELPSDATGADSPTVLDFGSTRYMAVRVTDAGQSVIALLRATDPTGSTFVWARGSLTDSVVVRPHEDFERFDHDDVSDPELARDGAGIVRLYYAGRRGTRWSIGVRVSGDGATWREPVGGPVLAGSGVGHDSLWTRHPSASVTVRGIELFYTASDGVTMDIGHAMEGRR